MKYAVIYQSKSGNTQKIANVIYESLTTKNKVIRDMDRDPELPDADVYFVGFGIQNNCCSLEIINLLEQITSGYVVIFTTCGSVPTDAYKANLETRLSIWLPDKAEYLGMFLCQGSVEQEQQEIMLKKAPDQVERLHEVFGAGSTHPDQNDCVMAADFAETIQRRLDHNENAKTDDQRGEGTQ